MLAPLICGKFNIHGISLEPCLQKSVLALLRVLQDDAFGNRSYCDLLLGRCPSFGGEFLLRIEDTDRERSTPEATQVILDAMEVAQPRL